MSTKLESLLQKSKEMNYIQQTEFDELTGNLIEIKKRLILLLEKLSIDKPKE